MVDIFSCDLGFMVHLSLLFVGIIIVKIIIIVIIITI